LHPAKVAVAQLEKTSFLEEKSIMPIKNPTELFVAQLSQTRHGTDRSAAIYRELDE
jgi:hypothetical protein